MACQRFVTHVTGFATLFGAELAQGRYATALGYLSVPLFFLGGAMISAFFVDQKILQGKSPLYHWSFGILSVITGAVVAFGVSHQYGLFGEPVEMGKDYSLLALLCLASGIQNATVTSAYGAVVRTSHLTGLTTDLGISAVRIFSSLLKSQENSREISASVMRLSIIAMFTLGSALSALVFIKTAYWGFVIPFVISLGLWFYNLRLYKQTPHVGVAPSLDRVNGS